jgi:hypothetical protein
MNLSIIVRDFQLKIDKVEFKNVQEMYAGKQYKLFHNILVASTEVGKQSYPYAYRLESAKMHSAEVINGITVAEMTFVGTDLNIIPSTSYWYVVNPSNPISGIQEYSTCKTARPSQLDDKNFSISNEIQFINILENYKFGQFKLQMGFKNAAKGTPDVADFEITSTPRAIRSNFETTMNTLK